MPSELTNTVARILAGSVDMHVHAGPDANTERRQGMVETAMLAQELGLGGLVFKSHEYPTAPCMPLVKEWVDDLKCFGSIALDHEVGGLNPAALEICAKLGGKVVWMPTFSAAAWRQGAQPAAKPGLKVVDEKDMLLPVVGEILDIVKQYDMVLATGHVSPTEIKALTAESSRRGVKTICTHVTYTMPVDDLKAVAAQDGVYLEHCWLQCLPQGGRNPQEFFGIIRQAGTEKSVLSTDLGQAHNPPPPEGFRMAIAHALRAGFSEKEVATMVRANPRTLLGMEPYPGDWVAPRRTRRAAARA